METRRLDLTPVLLLFGLLAFGLAGLSITDMFLPRPYDGVVLGKDRGSGLKVRKVIPDSGAMSAGLQPGDEIVGIGREVVRDAPHAARILNGYRIGDRVDYLVRRDGGLEELNLELGRRRIGDGSYFYICSLGFAFFFVGLFVLVRQPGLLTSQVFYFMCCLFLLFLVCWMRPASYSGIDAAVLSIGTSAFLLLPSAFLHFYMLFPRPAWLQEMDAAGRFRPVVWLFRRAWLWIYALPLMVFAASWAVSKLLGIRQPWLGDVPVTSWWLLALAMMAGLWALRANAQRIDRSRERRGVALVLLGSLFGLGPFVVASLLFPEKNGSQAFFVAGVMPLALVPVTFAYAIVRFQLLDIRVILRRSLLYTVTTALVTGLYAGGIAMFNAVFRDSRLVASGYFPIVLALAIVLLFDPVRRRVQRVIDRGFFAERARLQRAMLDLGEAMNAQADPAAVVRDLVERLPQILGFRFAALYLRRGDRLERTAGPAELPLHLPVLKDLDHFLERDSGLTRLDRMGSLLLRSPEVAHQVEVLRASGVRALADLASRRRRIGMVLFSGRRQASPLEEDESQLLQRLLDQASLALETGLLLEERTQQAELEREIEIAASIQAQLLPDRLRIPGGWRVAADCRPARIVGGDFFTQLPRPADAIVYGDVSGKSVSGALVMMAAHEALLSLTTAMDQVVPSRLFDLANERIYSLGGRRFVALGYFGTSEDGKRLRYLVAGQPPPLLRRLDGRVEELKLPDHRLPLGAMIDGRYQEMEIEMQPGELVLGYSDGVTDARSPEGDFFGEERLFDVVARTETQDPDRLVAEVLGAVDAFTRGELLYDDLTLVAVSRAD
ncbi:MAG: SpoIIE family protein phosphatase [Acidobacteriota bacterium]